jgi:hypothetical protein
MTLVLLAVGLIFAAAGLVTIGFGIPINAFSLGNTLIISGTIAVASGLILIGLALVLGQLKRIAEALKGKPLVRASVATESIESVAVSRVAPPPPQAAAQASEPQAAEPPHAPEPRAPEPRFPASVPEPAPGPLDWLRVKSKPVTTSAPSGPMPTPPAPLTVPEPPMVEVSGEAPLSPRPPRPTMPPGTESALEPKVWSPSRESGSSDPRLAPRAEPQMPRATPQVEPPKEKERFDLVWPDRGPAPTPSEPKVDIKREPALDMPLPPVPVRPRESRPTTERRMPEMPRKPLERGPAILKSGVIDGMPYTLYADGSIEAQLPQGMVKFASVDALRAHLEKQG